MSTRPPKLSQLRLLATHGRRIAVAGALAMFGLASSASAIAAPATLTPQLAPRLVGGVHWTATSGNSSGYSTVLEPRDDISQHGIRAFEWSERSDSPCWAELQFGALDGTTGGSYWRRAELTRCRRHRQSVKKVSRGQLHEMVTGVQVCLTNKSSSSRNKLKGVRLWGRTVDPETAALGPTNGPSHAERKHCSRWSRRVNCPAGEIAAKFKVFGATNSAGRHMQGISLGCREVELRPAIQATTLQPS